MYGYFDFAFVNGGACTNTFASLLLKEVRRFVKGGACTDTFALLCQRRCVCVDTW